MPETMEAAVLVAPGKPLEIREVPSRRPGLATLAVLALLPGIAGAQTTWSAEERENLGHLFASQRANQRVADIVSTGGREVAPEAVGEIVALNTEALSEARLVRDDVLKKLHPALPLAFRQLYVRSLELFVESFEEESDTKSSRSATLHAEWVAWWEENRKWFRPPDAESPS